MAKKKNLLKEKHYDGDRVLSQDEIDELLTCLAKDEEKFIPDERTRKVKIFDFKRPDIIGKEQMRGLSSILEEFCTAITKYFKNELELSMCVRVASVDQLTREEFIRSIPTPTFALSANWLGGLLLFEVDPGTFLGGFLGRTGNKVKNQKKTRFLWESPNAFEKNIFMQFVAEPSLKDLYTAFNKKSDEPLPPMSDVKFEKNPQFLPYGEWYCEMGALATLELSFEGTETNGLNALNIFFNAQILEELTNRRIIWQGEKNKVIELDKPMGNVVVELGRCRLADNLQLEKNMVLELDNLAGNPLGIYVDGKKSWKGEAVCIDDSKGVRICDKCEPVCGVSEAENYYNTSVVSGWASARQEETDGFGEGSIIELEQKWNELVFIYKNDVLIAKGEVVVLDENFAVKIKEVC